MADLLHAALPTDVLPATELPALSTRAVSQPFTRPTTDEVTLSTGAQAQQLAQSGQSVPQIAAALGLDAVTVDSYLGLTSSTSIPEAAVNFTVAKAAVDGVKLG